MTKPARLRAVGGSTVVAIPPALLTQLGLGPDASVVIRVDNGRLIVEPARKKLTLEERMALCDPRANATADERDWIEAPAVGRERV